jgi:hypothetical protein
MIFSWVLKPCTIISWHWRFGATWCLNLQCGEFTSRQMLTWLGAGCVLITYVDSKECDQLEFTLQPTSTIDRLYPLQSYKLWPKPKSITLKTELEYVIIWTYTLQNPKECFLLSTCPEILPTNSCGQTGRSTVHASYKLKAKLRYPVFTVNVSELRNLFRGVVQRVPRLTLSWKSQWNFTVLAVSNTNFKTVQLTELSNREYTLATK